MWLTNKWLVFKMHRASDCNFRCNLWWTGIVLIFWTAMHYSVHWMQNVKMHKHIYSAQHRRQVKRQRERESESEWMKRTKNFLYETIFCILFLIDDQVCIFIEQLRFVFFFSLFCSFFYFVMHIAHCKMRKTYRNMSFNSRLEVI